MRACARACAQRSCAFVNAGLHARVRACLCARTRAHAQEPKNVVLMAPVPRQLRYNCPIGSPIPKMALSSIATIPRNLHFGIATVLPAGGSPLSYLLGNSLSLCERLRMDISGHARFRGAPGQRLGFSPTCGRTVVSVRLARMFCATSSSFHGPLCSRSPALWCLSALSSRVWEPISSVLLRLTKPFVRVAAKAIAACAPLSSTLTLISP
jgi:hypothetical protein